MRFHPFEHTRSKCCISYDLARKTVKQPIYSSANLPRLYIPDAI